MLGTLNISEWLVLEGRECMLHLEKYAHQSLDPLFHCPLDRRTASQQARVLKAFADPHRLEILSLLRQYGDHMTVENIVESLDSIAQPSVSFHLSILMSAGLIEVRKQSHFCYYSIVSEQLHEAITWLQALLPVEIVRDIA